MMSTASPKRAVFEQFAQTAKTLGHAGRIEIIELLAQGERSVEAVAERTGMTVAATSQHLQTLKRAGLVSARRDGKFILYSVSGDEVIALISALRVVTEQHAAEMDRIVRGYFDKRDGMEPVSREELLERARAGLVTVLDVRPADEYAAGHIPGATNIPLAELEQRLGDLTKDREIIAYCRGPYCVYAFEAVAALRKAGFEARRLEGGLPQWRLAGLEISQDVIR
ncbi:ArsR/SmtB family transcription factor [Pelagibacterium halotolerans]|uniref:ArsR/SmtB family transcription factor n=1 Tax=Pelagibacterium halotolerans TaxID=531813 RepID=UPI00384DF469